MAAPRSARSSAAASPTPAPPTPAPPRAAPAASAAALARLFERRPPPVPGFRSLGAELDAVRAGRKAMSMFPLAAPGTDPDADAELRELLEAARARGLAVIVYPDEVAGLRGITAYALPLEQAWRVPAVLALWQAALEDGPWSDAAERQLGLLLGYSARERRAWIARGRRRSAAWGAPTMYALLDAAARARVAALGGRSLGPAAAIAGATCFAHARGLALRADAHRRAPRGLAIARAAIAPAVHARLFGGGGAAGDVRALTADRRAAAAIATGLRSDVELLGPRGWRPAR